VDTVDVVLGSVSIDEKFLGFTLFALVPNTTEFLNAISFALNGNIALSYLSLAVVLILVWKLDPRMHCRSVFYRFQRWLQ
jgi:Ca2+/H+ antiporter